MVDLPFGPAAARTHLGAGARPCSTHPTRRRRRACRGPSGLVLGDVGSKNALAYFFKAASPWEMANRLTDEEVTL